MHSLRLLSDVRDRVRDLDPLQADAIAEGGLADLRDGLGDEDADEKGAVLKGIVLEI